MQLARLTRFALGALVSACLLGGAAQAKDWTHIKVATEGAYPPFNSVDPSGKIIGYEPDLLQNLCARMKVTCELVPQSWDGIIPGLLAGKYDAIMSGMSITPKREETIAFTVPYGQGPSTFVVLKGSPLVNMPLTGATLSLADKDAAASKLEPVHKALEGKTVGVQVATIQLDLLNQYLKSGVDIRTYQTNDEIVLDLTSGRVDAMIGSQTNLGSAVEHAHGDIVYSGPLMVNGLLGTGDGIGLRKTDPELKAMFDTAIKAAVADGTTKALSMKWFHFDISPQD